MSAFNYENNSLFEWVYHHRLPFQIKFYLEACGVQYIKELAQVHDNPSSLSLIKEFCYKKDYEIFLSALQVTIQSLSASPDLLKSNEQQAKKKRILEEISQHDQRLLQLEEQYNKAEQEYMKLSAKKQKYLHSLKTEYDKQTLEKTRLQTKIAESLLRSTINEPVLTNRVKGSIDRSRFRLHRIPADGNCMYHSVLYGCQNQNIAAGVTLQSLRIQVSQEILLRWDHYLPELIVQLRLLIEDQEFFGIPEGDFLQSLRILSHQRKMIVHEDDLEEFDDVISQNLRDFGVGQYCLLIQSNGTWGGNVELGILSYLLGVQVIVHLLDQDEPHSIINNTGNADAPEVHVEYSGNHYNVFLPVRLN